MTSPATHGLWQSIVAATADLGPDASALRVPLLVAFSASRYPIEKRLGDALRAAGCFLHFRSRALPEARKGGVLFYFAHGTPANMGNLLPVAREAMRRGLVGGIITGEEFSAELSEFQHKVPVISIESVMASQGLPSQIQKLREVTKEYRRILSALSQRNPELAACLTEHRESLVRSLVESLQAGLAFHRLLSAWTPSCVISSSDFWPREHQLCIQAAKHRIPSFVIQHGTISEMWWPFVADVCCVWGNACMREMQLIGAPAHRLAVTGMPATDNIFQADRSVSPKQVARGGSPVCVILSQTHGSSGEPETFRNYQQFLIDVVQSTPSIQWKIKLHPAEDGSFYQALGSALLSRLTIYPPRQSLQEALAEADVAMTMYSTSGLEAMAMSRPLLVGPATPRLRELAPWPANGGGSYVSSVEDFQTQFHRLVAEGDYRAGQLGRQREFLDDFFANRGSAAKHIVDLLERVSRRDGGHENAGTADECSQRPVETVQ